MIKLNDWLALEGESVQRSLSLTLLIGGGVQAQKFWEIDF